MTQHRPILSIKNLQIALPQAHERPFAIKNLSLDIDRAEIFCLVGESGSGKSLTASAVMGLLPDRTVRVTGGSIEFDGRDLLACDERELRNLRGNRLAMIFQEPMSALNPQKHIGWQIDEVLRQHTNLHKSARQQKVLDILHDVHIPDPQATYHAYPHQISGGQRQRVMIAMALVLEPQLIIADEPTTALDVTTQAQILHLIKEMRERHQTSILFITHDFGVVAEIADRVGVLRLGEMVEQGQAHTILYRPRHPYTRTLIAAVPSLDPPHQDNGHTEGGHTGGHIATEPPILRISNLRKTYRQRGGIFSRHRPAVAAVKNISFTLKREETLGIVGESGSGKSTLARLVTLLLPSDEGEIEYQGRNLRTASGQTIRQLRQDIQIVFQDPMASLNPRKRVIDLIAQGPIVHGTSKSEAHAEARRLLEMVELPQSAAMRFPHEFSGGQRQRIGIARALALRPKILVADEPVSALDVSVQEQVLNLLIEMKKSLSLSMLFVTHDLRVAAQICDRVIVMSRGEIAEAGSTHSVYNNPQADYTRQLLNSIPGKDWQVPQFHDE